MDGCDGMPLYRDEKGGSKKRVCSAHRQPGQVKQERVQFGGDKVLRFGVAILRFGGYKILRF